MDNFSTDNGFSRAEKASAFPDGNIEGNGEFIQEVIHENDKIFEILKQTLSTAKFEILIASSWFTDPVLFDIIIERLKANVKVNIIIAENTDNEKLPFDKINDLGGFCIKIKSVGFGIMHQKFCVIDQKVAVHGSYNYTLNARNNNHESVIYTTYKKTVQNLIDTFNSIKSRAIAIKSGLQPEDAVESPSIENGVETRTSLSNELASPENNHIQEFEKVLSTLIEAEINHFDRKELYNNGFTRSESCSGDFNILNHSLDTIYYNFINDIDISAEQKKLLLVKISEHKSKKLQELDTESAQKQNTIKIENNTKKEIYTRAIKEKNTETEKNEKRVESIRRIDIENEKKQISEFKTRITDLKSEYVKPKFKLFDLIPLIFINAVLLIYLILFYSSAAYILIYSHADIHNSIKKGLEIPAINVFEPNAILFASKHGIVGLIFVLFFFILPLGFTLADRFIDNKRVAFIVSNIFGLGIVDIFVATFISKSIQEAKILTNENNVQWTLSLALRDINFYLVFVMGAMALLIFRYTYNKLMLCFSERNPTIKAQKASIEIDNKEQEIKLHDQAIVNYEKEIEKILLDNLEYKRIRLDNEYKLDNLPVNEAREIEKVRLEFNSIRQHCEHIADMYINKVENNNPRVSIDALKDRINTYLEGWNDFLHSYFAFSIAIEKSAKATEVVGSWLNSKLINNQIDSRVNH